MGIADKTNVKLRQEKATPLAQAEVDGNFQEIRNVIDDVVQVDTDLGVYVLANDQRVTNVETDLDTKVKVFDTVALMKDASLSSGDLVTTKGYHSAGDGGQARYLIQTSAEFGGTPDEYGNHTLANGNVAVLQVEGAVNVKQFGAVGDGVADDTACINSAIKYAAVAGFSLSFIKRIYRVSDSLIFDETRNAHNLNGNGCTLLFVNTEANKPLISLTPESSRSRLENFILREDANTRISTGVRISAWPLPSGKPPNWFNLFINIRIEGFNRGVHFTTDGNVLSSPPNYQADWASENRFLQCKMRDCMTSVLLDQYQSLNNNFFGCDAENTFSGDENSELIRFNAGGHISWVGGSLISKGRVVVWRSEQALLYPGNAGGCFVKDARLEIRTPHIGQLIYQHPGGSSDYQFSVSFKDIMIKGFGNTVDIVHARGGNYTLDNVIFENSTGLIRVFPVEGFGATVGTHARAKVSATNCRGIAEVEDRSTTPYGTTNRRYPPMVEIRSPQPNQNGSRSIDPQGFMSYRQAESTILSYGLHTLRPSTLVFNDPQETAGFTSLKVRMPNHARLLRFGIFKQPVRFANSISYKLYMVKDLTAWVDQNNFDPLTDAALVAEIPSTANSAGHFSTDIKLVDNIFGNNMISGEHSSAWKEGRLFIEHTGSEALGGFIYIEYL